MNKHKTLVSQINYYAIKRITAVRLDRVFEQVFRDYGPAVCDVYAQPILDRISKLKPSIMRDENVVCLLENRKDD